jgi:hypothetical protein
MPSEVRTEKINVTWHYHQIAFIKDLYPSENYCASFNIWGVLISVFNIKYPLKSGFSTKLKIGSHPLVGPDLGGNSREISILKFT